MTWKVRVGSRGFQRMSAGRSQELIAQKQALEALYTPDHPDVLAVSRKITELQKEIAHAPASRLLLPPPNREIHPSLCSSSFS